MKLLPTVSKTAIYLLAKNRETLLTDEELVAQFAKVHPESPTNWPAMVLFYRNRYNRGLLPGQNRKPPRVKIGRVAIVADGKTQRRVIIPAGTRGAVSLLAPMYLADAEEKRKRLEARRTKLTKKIKREERRKPDGSLRRNRKDRKKSYWVGPLGQVVRRILCPDGYHLRSALDSQEE